MLTNPENIIITELNHFDVETFMLTVCSKFRHHLISAIVATVSHHVQAVRNQKVTVVI